MATNAMAAWIVECHHVSLAYPGKVRTPDHSLAKTRSRTVRLYQGKRLLREYEYS